MRNQVTVAPGSGRQVPQRKLGEKRVTSKGLYV
jgi:hypothetical protein